MVFIKPSTGWRWNAMYHLKISFKWNKKFENRTVKNDFRMINRKPISPWKWFNKKAKCQTLHIIIYRYILWILLFELISDVLLWTLLHGQARAGRLARTYIQQLCVDTGVALKTSRKWWTIGRGGKRGSGISVLMTGQDDNDDDIVLDLFPLSLIYIYIYIY